MGPGYAKLAGDVLFILSMLLWTYPARQVMGSALVGLSRHKILVPIQLFEAGVNLGLSLLLVRRLGIIGVAWGTTVPGLIASVVLIPRSLGHVLQLPLRQLWWDIWVRPAVAIMPFGFALWLIGQQWEPDTILSFFGQVALVLPVAIAGVWIVGLTSSERLALRGVLGRTVSARIPRSARI
jgi:O-antigen/teichoic acid export membrane protein